MVVTRKFIFWGLLSLTTLILGLAVGLSSSRRSSDDQGSGAIAEGKSSAAVPTVDKQDSDDFVLITTEPTSAPTDFLIPPVLVVPTSAPTALDTNFADDADILTTESTKKPDKVTEDCLLQGKNPDSFWGNTVVSVSEEPLHPGDFLEFPLTNVRAGRYNLWIVAATGGEEKGFEIDILKEGVTVEHIETTHRLIVDSVVHFTSQLAAEDIILPCSSEIILRLAVVDFGLIFRRVILVWMPDEIIDPLSIDDVHKFAGMGINMGTTFEKDDSVDTDPEIVQHLLSAWWKMGYRNVRIPVFWGRNLSRVHPAAVGEDPLLPAPKLFSELALAVDFALELGFYVLVNSHNDAWLHENYNGTAEFDEDFAQMWKTIAMAFEDRGPRLMFELFNEPHNKFGQWVDEEENFFGAKDATALDVFDPIAINHTRQINNIAYQAVRSISKERLIYVEVNGYASISTLRTVYPDVSYLPGGGADSAIGVSLHAYNPQEYVFYDTPESNMYWQNNGGIQGMRNLIEGNCDTILQYMEETGISVMINEYGAGRLSAMTRIGQEMGLYYAIQSAAIEKRSWAGTVWHDIGWFAVTTSPDDEVYGGPGGEDFAFHDAIFGGLAFD